MRLTFLGTGSTSAPPLFGCECDICKGARAVISMVRKPASALIEAGETRLILDAGLHELGDKFPSGSFAAILLTHFHPDHVQGLFPMRWGVGEPISVFCPPDNEGCADLFKSPGILKFQPVHKFEAFQVGEVTITPVPLIHSKPTLGYCVEDGATRIAYLTDTIGLPPATLDFLKRWRPTHLVLDCSYPPRELPKNHNDFTLALQTIADVTPEQAYLTHIGHELDAWLLANSDALPRGVVIARDGMSI
ncbi:MAG: phosphonate metabolism protein PhnP [Methylotenera sp.]|nr:phosphonate metabolism protein PhnP [Methylotenera sp.]